MLMQKNNNSEAADLHEVPKNRLCLHLAIPLVMVENIRQIDVN